MEPGKNPLKQPTRLQGLYFTMVLVVLLALAYVALEWKTPYDDGGYDLGEPTKDSVFKQDSSVILRTKAVNQDTLHN